MFVQVWGLIFTREPIQPDPVCFKECVDNWDFLSYSDKLKFPD
jgi:hypothetical protein